MLPYIGAPADQIKKSKLSSSCDFVKNFGIACFFCDRNWSIMAAMISQIIVLLFKLITSIASDSKTCGNYQDISLCDFVLPKNLIFQTATILRNGVSQSDCLDKMARFDWSIGFFCESSYLCGLGLVIGADFSPMRDENVVPVSEVCQIFFDKEQTNCESFKAKVLRGN